MVWKASFFGWEGYSLNSVLNNISIYMLSFSKTPKGIVDEIINIQRHFLWGNGDGRGKVCWVS